MKKPSLSFSFLLFLIVFFSSLKAGAQWYDPDKVNKKAGEIYGQAYEAAQNGDYDNAIKMLNDALKLEPKFVDVFLSRAGMQANKKNYKASVEDFETALQMDPVYSNTYLLPYSISLAGMGNFTKALETVNKFLQTTNLNERSIQAGNYRKKSFEFALDYDRRLKEKGVNNYVFSPKNMGDAINSAALEYFPSFTVDGLTMIFTRRVNNDEDFYESHFSNNTWSKAEPLAGKINTNLNEGAQNISQDGEWLIFTGCNYPEGAGSCDLYIAYKTKSGGWTEAENMGPNINTEFWESSPSLSPDKRHLYFASNRLGGFGGKDIWMSTRQANGKWGKPENLGPLVNTKSDEGCPFIHADNETLYFNSNGHDGYGMTDLFLSKRTTDGGFGEAVNLGYPINTIDDEGSLIVTSDGKTSYFASDGMDTKGGLDLYSFTMRADVQANRTLWVKGKVFDKKTNAGLPSSVELTDIHTRKLVSKLQTDEDGNYLVTLPVGKDYAFNVNRKGYLFYSDNFSMKTTHPDSSLTINIPLQPIEAGAMIILKNIFFDSKQWELKEESKTELNQVVALMTENPQLKIMISGYTDNVGSATDNLTLSNNRAKAVIAYLLQNGINATRLSSKGFGAAKPVADNNTEEGRAQNRRTELNIVSN